jgi:hypothetical protein
VAPTITTSLDAAGSSPAAVPLLEQQHPPPSPPLPLLPSILPLTLLGRRVRFRVPSPMPAPATAADAMGERTTTVPILATRPPLI